MGPFQRIPSALKSRLPFPGPERGRGTALLVNALEEGLIDAVVTVSEDRWTFALISGHLSSDALIHRQEQHSWWVPRWWRPLKTR
jgi:coenzyme F420 hydrogenase subunit beta